MITIGHFNYKIKAMYNRSMKKRSNPSASMFSRTVQNFMLGYELTAKMKEKCKEIITDCDKKQVKNEMEYFL